MCAKQITWGTIPIWSKQQKELSFLVPVIMPTDSNDDPHPGEESEHDVQAKKEFATFCFSFPWGSQPDGWCWGLKVQSVQTCLFVTAAAPRKRGSLWGCFQRVHFCVLDLSLHSGVGMAGLEMAGWPLLSVLPLRQGRLSFLESKSFYSVERWISEGQRKRNSRRQQAGADISWQNFQCGWGVRISHQQVL